MDASLEKRAEQLATEFASQARTAEDLNGLMRLMVKSALERMLNTELDVHLGRRSLPTASPAEGLPASSIRFEGVRFRYPGQPEEVYGGLDLTIEAGRSLAVVGQNGAGKTTLIKLLTRLHDPTGGRITVDGIDLREIDPAAWQRRVAAIFQDFVPYKLTAADNVAFGALHAARTPESELGRKPARWPWFG